MQFGLTAHCTGADNMDKVIENLTESGAEVIQLSLAKALKDYNFDSGIFSPGFARYIKKSLDKIGVHVPILGSYVNLAETDEAKRKEQLDKFKVQILYAKYIGADAVATETGPCKEEERESKFKLVVDAVKELTDYAANFGVSIAIEAAWPHTICNAKMLKRLIDEVDAPNLGTIFDNASLMQTPKYSPDSKKWQHEIVDEYFDLLRERIFFVHLKDFVGNGSTYRQQIACTGETDTAYIMEKIKREKPHIDVILEMADHINFKEIVAKLG